MEKCVPIDNYVDSKLYLGDYVNAILINILYKLKDINMTNKVISFPNLKSRFVSQMRDLEDFFSYENMEKLTIDDLMDIELAYQECIRIKRKELVEFDKDLSRTVRCYEIFKKYMSDSKYGGIVKSA